jgi:hypothetical protein
MFLQILIVLIILPCASHVHTHKIVALIGCIDIGGVLLDFLKKYVKWHLKAKVEFYSICTYLGRANSICMDQNAY